MQIYEHTCGEIWSLVASPADKQLITTCYSSTERDCEKCSTLWRLPENDGQLENIISFPTEKYGTDVKVLTEISFYSFIIISILFYLGYYISSYKPRFYGFCY